MKLSRAAALAVALVAATIVLSACERGEPYGEGPDGGPGNDPVSVVKDFITDGVVDHNGYQACVYLTAQQQRAAAQRVGAGECRQAFDLARLDLGGETVQTVHEVERLAASSSVHGDRARVRLTRSGASIDFRLVRGDFAERQEFQAPDTDWRIAGGEFDLIPTESS